MATETTYQTINVRIGKITLASVDDAVRPCWVTIAPCQVLKWPDEGRGNPIVVVRINVQLRGYRATVYDEAILDDFLGLKAFLSALCAGRPRMPWRFSVTGFSLTFARTGRKSEIFVVGTTMHADYAKSLLSGDIKKIRVDYVTGGFANLLFCFPLDMTNLPQDVGRLERIIQSIEAIKRRKYRKDLAKGSRRR